MVCNDHPLDTARNFCFRVLDSFKRHSILWIGDRFVPGALDLEGARVVRVVFQVEDDRVFGFVSGGLGAGVLLGAFDGAMKERLDLVRFVSTDGQPIEKDFRSVPAVGVVATQRVDSKKGSKNDSREKSRRVG